MHHVFVDLENVPKVDLSAVEGGDVQVTLLIGKNQKKLDLALVRQIQRLGAQVELVEVGASGKNALDLTLAYYLGRTAERAPDTQFFVVSKDKDYAPMIAHLQTRKIEVTRIDSFAALPFLRHPKAVAPAKRVTIAPFSPPPRESAPARRATVPPIQPPHRKTAIPFKNTSENRHAKVIARLSDPASRNRPSTRKRLLAHIRNALGKETSDVGVEALVRELLERHALTIEPNGSVRDLTAR